MAHEFEDDGMRHSGLLPDREERLAMKHSVNPTEQRDESAGFKSTAPATESDALSALTELYTSLQGKCNDAIHHYVRASDKAAYIKARDKARAAIARATGKE